jgi:hypothetical protein
MGPTHVEEESRGWEKNYSLELYFHFPMNLAVYGCIIGIKLGTDWKITEPPNTFGKFEKNSSH